MDVESKSVPLHATPIFVMTKDQYPFLFTYCLKVDQIMSLLSYKKKEHNDS